MDLLDTNLNLSRYHREHEKYYALSPLDHAILLQKSSLVLKTLADRWINANLSDEKNCNRYMGCLDLNETVSIQHDGVLFFEGEDEPPEISHLKRNLKNIADDFEETGYWLSEAMENSWSTAKKLLQNSRLADVIGERHRITINDWYAAYLSLLVSLTVQRALDILNIVDFSPSKIRKDLKGEKSVFNYLYSASELIDHAAYLTSISAILVHDNDRRWRVFHDGVQRFSKNNKQKHGELDLK